MFQNKTLSTVVVLVALVSTLFILGLTRQQYPEHVVISAQEVLMKSDMGILVQQEIEALQSREQQNMNRMQEEIKSLENRAKNPGLSEADRENLGSQIQNKQISLQRYIKDAQQMIQAESQKRIMELQNRIMPVIQAVARENGYTLVFDTNSSGIAYFDQSIDITDLIVARLNSVR